MSGARIHTWKDRTPIQCLFHASSPLTIYLWGHWPCIKSIPLTLFHARRPLHQCQEQMKWPGNPSCKEEGPPIHSQYFQTVATGLTVDTEWCLVQTGRGSLQQHGPPASVGLWWSEYANEGCWENHPAIGLSNTSHLLSLIKMGWGGGSYFVCPMSLLFVSFFQLFVAIVFTEDLVHNRLKL